MSNFAQLTWWQLSLINLLWMVTAPIPPAFIFFAFARVWLLPHFQNEGLMRKINFVASWELKSEVLFEKSAQTYKSLSLRLLKRLLPIMLGCFLLSTIVGYFLLVKGYVGLAATVCIVANIITEPWWIYHYITITYKVKRICLDE